MSSFKYQPSTWVPFRDKAVIERVRAITRENLAKHENPDFRIHILPAEKIDHIVITDMFARIKASDDEDRKTVLIFPNPMPSYWKVAHLINTFRVDCRNLWVFAMDEYASEDNVLPPEEWPFSFKYAMYKYFYYSIDADLRPPKEQVIGPTNENCRSYSRMIEDAGYADACYSGPGWTGHLAFIEPDSPEYGTDNLEEWMKLGAGFVTLSPFTLAQNSMHGFFGKSGDLSAVPPKAFTIGPKEVVESKNRIDSSSITVHGTTTSWQRLITRLVTHGPVTPRVPTSIHQLLKTDLYISEENAMDIEPDWNKGY